MILLKKLGYTFTTLPHLSANREIQKSFKKSKKRGGNSIMAIPIFNSDIRYTAN